MPKKRTSIQPGQKLELDLSAVERKAILDNLLALPPEYEAMLKKVHAEQPLLLTLDELEDFSGYVAAESNHTTKKKLRTILDSAFEKMTDLLDQFTDEEPAVKKTTKKSAVAEREDAERQGKLSEQAVFLATWAAGVLHFAEKQGAKSRVLDDFVPSDIEKKVLSTLPSVHPEIRKKVTAAKSVSTLAEVGGMLIAVSEGLCGAREKQEFDRLVTAQYLMAVLQDWVGESMANEVTRNAKADRGRPRAKKTPSPRRRPKE